MFRSWAKALEMPCPVCMSELFGGQVSHMEGPDTVSTEKDATLFSALVAVDRAAWSFWTAGVD
jgi:hypothetical protein